MSATSIENWTLDIVYVFIFSARFMVKTDFFLYAYYRVNKDEDKKSGIPEYSKMNVLYSVTGNAGKINIDFWDWCQLWGIWLDLD